MGDFLTASLIWDAALAALILFVVIRSVRRGFVSSFIHLLGVAASCIVAALTAGKAAAWLYDGYLAERVEQSVSDSLREKLEAFAGLLDRIDPTDTISAAAGDAVRTMAVSLLTMVAFLIIFLLAMLIVRAAASTGCRWSGASTGCWAARWGRRRPFCSATLSAWRPRYSSPSAKTAGAG